MTRHVTRRSNLCAGHCRSILWQLLAVAAFALIGFWAVTNAARNMARRSITFGFDFLWHPAGFDIPFHLLNWQASDSYGWALAVCFANTMLVAVLAIGLASLLGLVLALMRLSGNPLAVGTARGILEVVRNTPQLVQIIFVYFVILQSLPPPRASLSVGAGVFLNVRGLLVPQATIPALMWLLGALALGLSLLGWFARRPGNLSGRLVGPFLLAIWAIGAGLAAEWEVPVLRGFNFVGGLRFPPELLALWLGLSIYTSAFISESIRASILGVDHGQTEAALSTGLRRGQVLYLVVLPQALRTLIPPLTSQYLNIIKSTTLGAAIAYPDVLQIFGRTVLNQSGRAIEVMALLLGLFLAINLLVSTAMNVWNRRLAMQSR